MPEQIKDKTVFSLLEVTKSIQKAISDRYQRTYWIKAEMNKLNYYSHSGHAYPELVEKKDGKIVAEIRSILWRNDFKRINKQFIDYLGEPLKDGITVIFEAGISFDPLYGLSLKIVDIDVSFVLGELEKEKIESISKLKKEGIFELNKRLTFPLLPKRLAIISVETSKGLSDFYKIIDHNPWGYKFQTTLYPALLQGDRSINSIINQMAVIAEKVESYDTIAIIRGGGGEVGLSSYNNYLLAKAIALFPIPVITGIGHSTNETVSEMVAYKNAITPSELADFLIQKFHNFSVTVQEAEKRIKVYTNKVFETERNNIKTITNTLGWISKSAISRNQHIVDNNLNRFLNACKSLIIKEKQTLQSVDKILKLTDPIHILKRGFSIIRKNGVIITDTTQIEKGDIITNELKTGTIKSQVTTINTHINEK